MGLSAGTFKMAGVDVVMQLCQKWSALGSMVQEQAAAVARGAPVTDQNPAAMRMVLDWLRCAAAVGVDDYGLIDQISSVVDDPKASTRAAQRRLAALSEAERMAVVSEEGEATNAHKLDLTGTHYVDNAGLEIDWLWNI